MSTLSIDNACLLVVDAQGKLARVVRDSDDVIAAAGRLVRGAAALSLPVVWSEQTPDKLGPTVPELAELLDGEPVAKATFSCWGEPALRRAIEATGRNQAILAGIEAHICVCQTARDMLSAGYEVHVAVDAVSSRTDANRRLGLERIAASGGTSTSVETALFEMMGTAEHPAFRDVLKIIR